MNEAENNSKTTAINFTWISPIVQPQLFVARTPSQINIHDICDEKYSSRYDSSFGPPPRVSSRTIGTIRYLDVTRPCLTACRRRLESLHRPQKTETAGSIIAYLLGGYVSKPAKLIAAIFVVGSVSGCGNFMSIKHDFKPDNGDSISIDAKQRTIYSLEKIYRDPDSDRIRYKWRAVCAEPSPDALSAITASAGIDAQVVGKAISGALSGSESAASIGLRTQTIQLLRDAMYRLCEGYASGALDDTSFARLQRRYQNIMMGLLAIEQLTGTVMPKQAAISGSASASIARALSEIQAQLSDANKIKAQAEGVDEKAAADLKQKTTDFNTADAAYKKALKDNNNDKTVQAVKDAEDASSKAQKALDAATTNKATSAKALKIAAADVKAYEDLRSDLGNVSTRAITNVALEGGSTASLITSTNVQALSVAVKDIVKELVNRDYSRETCLDAILSRDLRGLADQYKVAVAFCQVIMQVEVAQIVERMRGASAQEQAAINAQLQNVKAGTDAMQKAIDSIRVREEKPGTQPPANQAPK